MGARTKNFIDFGGNNVSEQSNRGERKEKKRAEHNKSNIKTTAAAAASAAMMASRAHESKLYGNETSLCDIDMMVIGFLDEDGEGYYSQESYGSSNYAENESLDVDEEAREKDGEDDDHDGVEEEKKFWEDQHQLLQSTLCRTSSLETKIRNITKEAIKELENSGTVCACGRPMAMGSDCRKCLMTEVCGRLRNQGLNSAICKSKWKSSPYIPSGEHTFMDVVENSTSSKRPGEVRVIIELNFRAEFEMARACQEYTRLVQTLPKVFVGKVERLQGLIKILCLAAKKCMKEKKMHLGPWRKQKYMQAKWLGPCERMITTSTTSTTPLSMGNSGARKLPKPRQASMLTVDLLDVIPNLHCTAVEVV